MRFAITASDTSYSVFNAFLKAGWEPVKLFVFSTQGSLDSNHKVIELAESRKISVQLSRMTQVDLRELAERECEVLIVANYQWRIGNWRPYLKHAVNFHPSPLPRHAALTHFQEPFWKIENPGQSPVTGWILNLIQETFWQQKHSSLKITSVTKA